MEEGGGKGQRLLDVGTGSGILALGALALNPTLLAVGTEADPRALVSLRTNLSRNDAGGRFHPVLTEGIPCPEASFDRATANLTELEHRKVEVALSRALAPGGHLVLSGLLEAQARSIEERWQRLGFRIEDRRSREGWSALALRKRG